MTKTDKINKCRAILHKYPINSRISDFNDIKFLQSIFEGHSEWDLKKGSGIDFISIKNTPYNNQCFYLHRTDNTETDISFMHSISNRSDKANIKTACRSAIRAIVTDFRDKNVIFHKSKCPITGEILTPLNTHIDHYDLTFNDLFNLWIKDKDIDSLKRNICETKDRDLETYFTDSEIIIDFRGFHNRNTHLRAVSKSANLSILNTR